MSTTQPPPRRSIYCGPPINRLLESRSDDNISGTLNAAIDRYLGIVRRVMPRFHLAEWNAIMDAMNGSQTQSSADIDPGAILANVADAIRYNGLAEKWEIDPVTLVDQLRELDYPAQVALLDAVERYWYRGQPRVITDIRADMATIVGPSNVLPE
jgi:hypothetical protein